MATQTRPHIPALRVSGCEGHCNRNSLALPAHAWNLSRLTRCSHEQSRGKEAARRLRCHQQALSCKSVNCFSYRTGSLANQIIKLINSITGHDFTYSHHPSSPLASTITECEDTATNIITEHSPRRVSHKDEHGGERQASGEKICGRHSPPSIRADSIPFRIPRLPRLKSLAGHSPSTARDCSADGTIPRCGIGKKQRILRIESESSGTRSLRSFSNADRHPWCSVEEAQRRACPPMAKIIRVNFRMTSQRLPNTHLQLMASPCPRLLRQRTVRNLSVLTIHAIPALPAHPSRPLTASFITS